MLKNCKLFILILKTFQILMYTSYFRLLLLMKLTVVMGVPFTFEVITTTYSFDNNKAWQITALFFDLINSLQGQL